MFVPKKIAAIVLMATFVARTDGACNKNCNGHGTCGMYDKCDCHHKWNHPLAEDCSMRVCPYGQSSGTIGSTVHSYQECSDQGSCNRATGECECYDGFSGHACQRIKCPQDCSGHGQCQLLKTFNTGYDSLAWDADQKMICDCDPGYEGPGCERRSCPVGDDPLTLYMAGLEMQVDEVQECVINVAGVTMTSTGETFSLQFTDWSGQVHETFQIATKGLDPIRIAEALKALPNNVIPEVEVSIATKTDTAITFSVTFTSSDNASRNKQGPKTLSILATPSTDAGVQPYVTGIVTATGDTISCSHVTPSGLPANVNGANYESKVCAGRGTCDHETGMCVCNTGFYGQSCDKQTALQ